MYYIPKALIITLFIYLFTVPVANGQYGTRGIKYVEKVKETTTYFVLEPHVEEYNAELKDAVEKYWTFTKAKFITSEELAKICTREDISFIRLINTSVSKSGTVSFDYNVFNMALFLGGEKNLDKYGIYDIIGYANMITEPYFRDKSEFKENYPRFFDILYKRGAIKAEVIKAVQSLNNYCYIVMENTVYDNNNKAMIRAFNENKGELRKKTLLIAKDDVSDKKKNNEAALKAAYPYKIKFVTREEIWKAIEEQQEDICYAQIYYETRNLKLKAIIQAKDSKVLFGEVSKLGNGLFHVSAKTLRDAARK